MKDLDPYPNTTRRSPSHHLYTLKCEEPEWVCTLARFDALYSWLVLFLLFIAFSITTYMSFRDYPPSFYGFNRLKHAYLSQEVIAFSFTVESVLLTVAALSSGDGGNPLVKAMCFFLYVVNGLICISVRWRIKEVIDSASAKRRNR